MTQSQGNRVDALWRAYEQTIFRVFDGPREIRFRIGGRSAELDELLEQHGATTWAHITAWNPASGPFPLEENEGRQQALVDALGRAGYVVLAGDGCDPEGRWPPEATAFVLGIGLGEAQALGREYGQLAIVAGQPGQPPSLVACAPLEPA